MTIREKTGEKIKSPSDVADIFFKIYASNNELDKEKEQLYLMGLDSKNSVLLIELVSMGTVNECLVSPREIYKTALIKNCVNIILVHNHPSGDVAPSNEDIAVTKKVMEAGKLLDIPLLDHVIIGDNSFNSMKSTANMPTNTV